MYLPIFDSVWLSKCARASRPSLRLAGRSRATLFDSALVRLSPGGLWKLPAVFALTYPLAATSVAETTTYVYDALGRLTTVTTPNGTDQSVTTYYYDESGNRESVVVEIEDITPPNTPTGLTATAQSYDLIRLDWTPSQDVGGDPVSHYRIYRDGVHMASPNGPPFDDWPLTGSTSYSYTVSAVDTSDNESAQSSSTSETTPAAPDVDPPSAPGNLQGTAVSGTRVDLTWSPSQDTGGSGLAGYKIYRDGSQIGTSVSPSHSDHGASVATTHQYKVRAYDGADNHSGFSDQIPVTTPDTLPPSAPGSPTFSSITATTATASWSAATDNVGVTAYRYSLNSGSSWTNVGSALSTNLTGLTADTSYTMLIRARDGAGNWGPSVSDTFTTSYYTDNMSFAGSGESDLATYIRTGYSCCSLGSLSPDTTADGKTVLAYTASYYDYPPAEGNVNLIVWGFTGNPGVDWLYSVSGPNGLTFMGANASFYCYDSDTRCVWYWPREDFVNFNQVYTTLTIVHK